MVSSSQQPAATAGLARSRSLRKPASASTAASTNGNGTPSSSAPELGRSDVSPSRLPVKGGLGGALTGLTRAASVRTGTSTADTGMSRSFAATTPSEAPAKKGRTLGGLLGRSTSVRQPQSTSQEPSRPPITRSRAPTTNLSRPTSSGSGSVSTVSRPTTSSGVPASAMTKPRAATGGGHTRTKSSATALTSATTFRPPSQSSTTSSGGTHATPGVDRDGPAKEKDRSRPPLSSNNGAGRGLHRRQGSATAHTPVTSSGVVTRQSSKSLSATTAPALAPHSQPPLTSTSDAPRLRPVFTAFQQHYSPAKSLAPKPLTASYLAPPSPSKLPANVAASAETSRLQTELLQLHLLHRDAGAVDAAWRASARKKLGARFAALGAREAEIGELEGRVVERENVAALRAWGEAGRGRGIAGLEEKVRVLDAVVNALWTLGETPGGKYARLVRRFEKWAEKVEGVVEARRSFGGNARQRRQGEGLLFVSELDDGWKLECEGLGRRLDEYRRLLRDIGDAPGVSIAGQQGDEEGGKPASSLAVILGACRTLVHDMLTELDLMERIERDAIAQENEWVRAMNRVGTDVQDEYDTPRAGAIWRAL